MNDVHDEMIKAFQEYSKYNLIFVQKKTEQSHIKARLWLSEIRRLARIRRKEIKDQYLEVKKARNGRNGRPPKIHSE